MSCCQKQSASEEIDEVVNQVKHCYVEKTADAPGEVLK